VIAGVYYLNIIKEVFFYLPDECFRESLVRVKLSNFREPLKLLVPSDNRKIISGWINYSCKVISQKIIEKWMGYCVSKSVMALNLWKNITVKEQRVGGSCSINLMLLRCTLTGFERNFQVRTLFTRISIQRYYTHKAVQ